MRFSRAALSTVALLMLLLPTVARAQKPEGSPTPASAENSPEGALVRIKRIYVESFGDDTASKQIQAMLINSLSETKRFVVTENKEKADAVMKGSTLETASRELHSSSEFTASGGSAIGDAEKSTETVHHARIAVRLVAADGDVVWTSTQESSGAKYKGASADVADKVIKQLMRDLEKLEKKPAPLP